ncbi:MAG: type II toxin-antitoxin system VapC family toxin [Desulfococcaceae bacterium]
MFDTHTFIWWDSDPERLSDKALELCQNENNELILSTVSLWEMQIKIQIGKLQFDKPLKEIVEQQKTTNQIVLLPVHPDHIFALEKLPSAHKDPFDRLLIAQAKMEEALLVSADRVFSSYPVEVVW